MTTRYRVTPPLQATGRYSVRQPFVINEATVYKCIALRKFADIEAKGVDVFKTYYATVGLDLATYREDARMEAVIVTLLDPYGNHLYIPDTFIVMYPNMGDVPYNHVVLSVSIGALPDYVPLDNIKQAMAELVSDMLGSEGVVLEHIAPSRNQPTSEQHEMAEAARVAAIKQRETTRALLLLEQQRNIELTEKYNALAEWVVANSP